jgi:hypothetical protein
LSQNLKKLGREMVYTASLLTVGKKREVRERVKLE